MSLSPVSIRRCQHIKVNGTQCGSPAMRDRNYCYFHMRWHRKGRQVNAFLQEQQILILPTLEDANSIQVGLADIMRQLATKMIDHRTAGLLLYAVQIASANLKHTSFEPDPALVIVDRDSVAHSPLGTTACSTLEALESGGRETLSVETELAPSPPNANQQPDSTLKQLTERQN
jgi:hypothetical protein